MLRLRLLLLLLLWFFLLLVREGVRVSTCDRAHTPLRVTAALLVSRWSARVLSPCLITRFHPSVHMRLERRVISRDSEIVKWHFTITITE